jgi:hypothetical protein
MSEKNKKNLRRVLRDQVLQLIRRGTQQLANLFAINIKLKRWHLRTTQHVSKISKKKHNSSGGTLRNVRPSRRIFAPFRCNHRHRFSQISHS